MNMKGGERRSKARSNLFFEYIVYIERQVIGCVTCAHGTMIASNRKYTFERESNE